MAAASWMRIASRGGVSYRRIISATEAPRAFSPIFAAVPSPPPLYSTRIFPATDRSFCLSPRPHDAATTTALLFSLPCLRSSTLFFSNARFFFSMALRSACFLSLVKDNKSHGTEKNRNSLRELNSLIGYWDIFLRSFFLRISIFRSFLFEEELIKCWTIFISIISVVEGALKLKLRRGIIYVNISLNDNVNY